MRPTGLFDLPDHFAQLSKTGDPLEVLNRVWQPPLYRATNRSQHQSLDTVKAQIMIKI